MRQAVGFPGGSVGRQREDRALSDEVRCGARAGRWPADDLTVSILYIDEHMTYALTIEGIFWLYRWEESEKVRCLGG